MKSFYIIALLIPAGLMAQGPESYTASNGITYHIGDTVWLGRGSAPSGYFNYMYAGGIFLGGDPTDSRIGATYAGLPVIVRKIKELKLHGHSKTYLVVDAHAFLNFSLMIDDAIAYCEVTPCYDQRENTMIVREDDKYDKLRKAKALLDEGVLTQEEFEGEKRVLLGSGY